MQKLKQRLIAGTLALGLLIGAGGLFSTSTASAATIQLTPSAVTHAMNPNGTLPHLALAREKEKPQLLLEQRLPERLIKQEPPQPQYHEQVVQVVKYNQEHSAVGGNVIAQVAGILGVSEQTILDQLGNGSTLVEIARDYGVSESRLLNQLEHLQKEAINRAVDNGVITSAQGDTIKDQLADNLERIIEGTF